MKKLLFLVMLSVFMIGMNSCNRCNKDKGNDNATEQVDSTATSKLDFARLVAADRQEMFVIAGDDYRWYETCMRLNNYLDEENDGTLAELVNVFQAVVARSESSFDTKVYKFQHFSDGTNLKDSIAGFWVEDEPMNDAAIQLTYEQAYEKLMETNIPKPHSRYVTLRKQVGPKEANPQYIFGNVREQVYVDAVTGEVLNYNPAFGPDLNLGTPLGEWP